MKEYILQKINDSIVVKNKCLNADIINIIEKIANVSIDALKRGNKIILFGNGGSSTDAMHIAAELIGRFEKERNPLFAIALTSNTSCITAIGNDYGFENIFKRQIEAIGKKGDVAFGFTTSGKSKNVILAIKKAKEIGMVSVGFTGEKIGDIDSLSDIVFHAPSNNTARIQETHIMAGHIICGLIEEKFMS